MSSDEPIPSNILLDPLSELSAAINASAWGISSSRTLIHRDGAFPDNPEQLAAIKKSSLKEGKTDGRVKASARIGLLDGEGEWVDVMLDQRGYTIIHTSSPFPPNLNPTFESLEALLIALSPAYVAAMTLELNKKFNEEDLRPRAAWREDEDEARLDGST